MGETSTATIVTFVIYIVGVFVLAGFSHRLLSRRAFLGEYFLGSRGLGSWALAFTFAATSSSGGSFTGYPSLIYSYGWVLAFWIASYMVLPLTTMVVMGKRLNQVARVTGAITIPDVLRDRYESTTLGLFATCTIIFFTVCNLVAQFKAGALIIEETFNLPATWGYYGGLALFAGTVVFYTAYGGFRAVVWTDVMQGIVMGLGVVVLLPVVVSMAGGLGRVNRLIMRHPPLAVTSIQGQNNDLAFLLAPRSDGEALPVGVEYVAGRRSTGQVQAEVRVDEALGRPVIRIILCTDAGGQVTTTASEVRAAALAAPAVRAVLRDVHYAYDNDGTGRVAPMPLRRFIRGDDYVFGPGRRPDGSPFHPLGMAISFFFMWAISGMGQPGTMVRLMAFHDSRTLKRAVLTVTFYYAAIYLPLVFIFVSARTLLPYIPQESSDKAMALVTTRLVAQRGLGYQVLGAIFVAAPFAAIMSTVDSFLLLISSSLVRDIYQRTINPNVSERAVRMGSYGATVVVGVLVTAAALRPPDFLQYIIVFTGGGFASTFLFPTLLGLYWKGMTRQGALASMIGGFAIMVGLFLPKLFGGERINLMGFHPVFWGLAGSLLLAVVVSKLSGPAPGHLVQRYFYRAKPAATAAHATGS